ncbi:MAG: hypothetical protein ACRDZZ_11990 [Ilumatobacteraceae bacterium]
MDPMVEIDAGDTVWRFDRTFLTSTWTCIWGRGCRGILPEPAEHLGHGCCSVGADLHEPDEAMGIAANAAMLRPERFENHADAAEGGIFSDATRLHTRVVDGACIFLNRPGFAGGAGCALHLAAAEFGESPIDWKPSVCWQLPVRVEWEEIDERTEAATVRGWTRADWGPEGETMAWCCTEEPEAYVGERPVVDSLAEELTAIVGEPVYVELRRRLADG